MGSIVPVFPNAERPGAWRSGGLGVAGAPNCRGALLVLRDLLNADGEYRCVYTNVETAQTARGGVEEAMQAILGGLGDRALSTLGDDFVEANRGAFLGAKVRAGA